MKRLPATPMYCRRAALPTAIHAAFAGSLVATFLLAPSAAAETGSAPEVTLLRFDIPPGDLAKALSAAALRGGVQLSFDAEMTRGRQTAGLSGDFTAREALSRLLAGSGLVLTETGGIYSIVAPPPGAATTLPAVKVEATADRLFDPPPEQGGFKADFQESATKTPLSILETPQSISVITRESMDARQVRDINSALELTAGIAPGGGSASVFGGSGIRGGERFVLRGQTADNRRDVRNDGFAGTPGDSQVDPALFERVEYIKGPSSALYGTGSLSGFINRVTKKPSAERRASASLSVGSFDTYRAEVDLGGALDAQQNYAARLVGVYDDSGSFVNQTDRQVLLIAPSLSARLGERTRLLVQTFYQDVQGTPQGGIPLQVLPDGELRLPERIPQDRYPGVVGGSRLQSKEHHVSLRLDHEFSDRWLATLLLQQGRNEYRSQLDGYAYGIDTDGNTALYSGIAHRDDESWAGELRLDGHLDLFGREHRLLFGAERRLVDADLGFPYANVGTGNLYTGEFDIEPQPLDDAKTREVRLESQSLFGQVILSLAEHTRLILGLRHEQAQPRNRSNVGLVDEQGVSIETRDEAEKDATTYRIGLSQDLTPQISAFAAYATSFIPVLDLAATGATLEPETGKGLELGLKGEWFEGRLGANLSVFRQERDKVPLGLTREECLSGGAGLTSCSRSAGMQQFDGLEIEASGKPLPDLTLGFAASWLDGEFTERSDPDFGRKLPQLVERQTNLYLDYAFARGSLQGLGLGATLVSVGDRGVFTVGQFLPSYERVDFHLRYSGLPRWDFRLLVRNLFDERYIERPIGSFGNNFEGSPTAALFRAEYKFKL